MLRAGPWLSLVVIGLLAGTVNSACFVWFLSRRYKSVFTLDGEFFVRREYLLEYVTHLPGSVLTLAMIALPAIGLIGLHCVHRRTLGARP